MTENEKQTLALLRQEMRAERAATKAALELATSKMETKTAEMDGKLDLLVQRTEFLGTSGKDVETRVRSLERWRYGIPAGVASGATALIAVVARHLKA